MFTGTGSQKISSERVNQPHWPMFSMPETSVLLWIKTVKSVR